MFELEACQTLQGASELDWYKEAQSGTMMGAMMNAMGAIMYASTLQYLDSHAGSPGIKCNP
eukprot:1161987-Pelagomonas_calceolata.AAC.2